MTHLIIFTIGPVQSFITQARKTQDLFAGSRLLSELAGKCNELLEKQTESNNIELIFPVFYSSEGNRTASNPNRLAVKIIGKNREEINAICIETKEKLNDYFVKTAEDLLVKLPGYASVKAFSKTQLESLLEIYWAAIEFDTADYHNQYNKLESYLGGIKNIRAFSQLEEQGRKCNVDGIRNALFYKHSNINGQETSKPVTIQAPYCQIPKTDTRLTPGEGLSAVSMFKRLAKQEDDFPSTAKIALMDVLDSINKEPDQKELLEKYKKLFAKNTNNWDEQLLFEENLTQKYFDRQGLTDVIKEHGGIEKVVAEYNTLKQSVGNLTSSYYAVLVFDADNMGQWMSGDKLIAPSSLYHFQKKMAELLNNFATWVITYLGEPKGKAVYAGGDDFLGFINLHHLYEVLITLRTKFDELINIPLQQEKELFQLKSDNQFSFSAGVSIAHYKQPLGLVLDEARKAEQAAKKTPGKNSWAISVIRHSGGTTTCVQPFGKEHNESVGSMQFISKSLHSNDFSNKFIHNLIGETRYWNNQLPKEIFKIEAIRLVNRAKSPGVDNETISKMVERLEILFKDNYSKELDIINNTTNSLRVCDFIYRCTKNKEKYEYA